MRDFVHLHVHSEYSLLDGHASPKAIVERAAELGMPAIALTDHGVLYGALDFYDAAKKAGIKPVIGVEAFLAPRSRTDPMVRGGKNYFHLLLLAKNEVGYRNLVKLTTRAHLEGMGGKGVFARPRIDWELLTRHAEGLIATSSCMAGEVIHAIKELRDPGLARSIAARHQDLFGADNYYIELQLHDNTPELVGINDELIRIATELNIPIIATSDSHFVRPHDLPAQKLMMAMGFNMSVRELCARGYDMDPTYHIASGEEMWNKFRHYGASALENTLGIAERCDLSFTFGNVELPAFPIPDGHTASSYLRLICEEGLMRRMAGQPPELYVDRLRYELQVIDKTGFPDYMLIVWDYVKYARSRGIPCLPRGSAGASLVLYCLGITDVDPVANGLLFERFLSPERPEMPDIDIDFADSRRGEVLDYLAHTYGRENVAQIITFGSLKARAALRDVGRALEVPLADVDRIARLIPALPVGTTIAQAIERVPDLKKIYDDDPDLRRLIDEAQRTENRIKSVGTHACGVVISRTPLAEIVPLQRTTKDEAAVMAAYEGPTLAKVGLLKMDVLGLTHLSVAAETLTLIRELTGEELELSAIPTAGAPSAAATFEALARGDTVNVFQLESPGMTKHLRKLKPSRVEDLYAMVALYRPGPLEQIEHYIQGKTNPRQISYLHPILKPILEDTYGVIVYQEQIMRLLQAVADYTLGQAYIVLKAIGKKNKELMAAEEPRFKQGCLKQGISQEVADQLWDLIQPFAGYSFNRPHATLYGLLSYQTAWLKVNHRLPYTLAILRGDAGKIDRVAKTIIDSRQAGVVVLPPDINRSDVQFSLEELPPEHTSARRWRWGVRYGLGAIKTAPAAAVQAIVDARRDGGPFESIEALCERTPYQQLNRRTLETLIKAGALDSLPGSRRQKLAIVDQVLSAGEEAQRSRSNGQMTMLEMFDGPNGSGESLRMPMPSIEQTPETIREESVWERELIGVSLAFNPIDDMLRPYASSDVTPIITLTSGDEEEEGAESADQQSVTLLAVVTEHRIITTRQSATMLVGTLEDATGRIEFVAFPRVHDRYKDLLKQDAVLYVTGRVELRNGSQQLVIERCERPKATPDDSPPGPSSLESPPVPQQDAPARSRRTHATHATAHKQHAAVSVVPHTAPAIPQTLDAPQASTDVAVLEEPVLESSFPARKLTGDAAPAAQHPSQRAAGSLAPGRTITRSTRAPAIEHSPAPTKPVLLSICLPQGTDSVAASEARMREIAAILRSHPGKDDVYLRLARSTDTVILQPRLWKVAVSESLLAALAVHVGRDALQIHHP